MQRGQIILGMELTSSSSSRTTRSSVEVAAASAAAVASGTTTTLSDSIRRTARCAIYRIFEKRPRGEFSRHIIFTLPTAHARGIKTIPREMAHTLKAIRHIYSHPVRLLVARRFLVAPEHSLIRQRTGLRTNGLVTRSRTLIPIPHVTCLDPTSFPTHPTR